MNTSLPVYTMKSEIINAVEVSPITIITAETGSGKSTQIPQYLYEAGYEVVVTEPRRMAAWSLAERVAEEMNTTLGDVVGFRTGFERMDSKNTSVLYCTDGLELVKLLTDTINRPKILVIDEVHEWNLNIETLIAWAKKKISENWNTKVVIMSATLEVERLARYYGKENTSILEIPGKTFPVTFEQREKYFFIDSIKECIADGRNTLVFVPGKKEIEDVVYELKGCNAVILPLHGELDYSEQKKCFQQYSLPKIVVTTNIAQTSITIPDIDAVIDSGVERRMEVFAGIQGLFLRNISRADCMQRKGRAGRTKEGKYILCSDYAWERRSEFSMPEIQRGILDQIVLHLATCGIDATQLEFFHQPSEVAISNAKTKLLNLGALKNNIVTPLGYKMSNVPISVEAARMIIEAEKYGVTEDAITIASILEVGSLLKRDGTYCRFTSETTSDLFAELDVWNFLKNSSFIDFDSLKINKKIYYRIKEHIQKMHEVLQGKIEITNTGDRKALRKACFAGLINNVFAYRGSFYVGEDGAPKYLEKKSCIWNKPNIIVGKPRMIEFVDRYGFYNTMEIITMSTAITLNELEEMASEFITYGYDEEYYSEREDVVKRKKRVYFKGFMIGEEFEKIENSPNYETLKNSYFKIFESQFVTIDGKRFEIHNGYKDKYIVLDKYTLFNTEKKYIYQEDGTLILVTYELAGRKEKNILALRNIVENAHIRRAWDDAKSNLPVLKSNTLDCIDTVLSILDKQIITYRNGGYGEPIYGFVCLTLDKKNSLHLEILEEEILAKEKTQQAIEFLYEKAIIERYSEKKFKLNKTIKFLTPKERMVKEEFDNEVRELLCGLNITNILERLEYLNELYEVMVKDLKVV